MTSPDRFPDIKRQMVELDADGKLSPNSPLRWLVGEVDRLRQERADVVEELARRYGGMFASPMSEPATTKVFQEARQLADQRLRKLQLANRRLRRSRDDT